MAPFRSVPLRGLYCWCLALLILVLFIRPLLAEPVPEPDGYRGKPYGAPVPATLKGAVVLTTGKAHALWEEGAAIFIDVLPRLPKPENLPQGTIWRDKPRHSIPGSIWLPNVGYQEIPEVDKTYFVSGLEKATRGDKTSPVVIFCRADCWMSWNAAKRALEYGYSAVNWYPEGTDGWAEGQFPTELIEPEDRP